MSEVIDGLKYTNTHEWVRIDADGTCVMGITDHAQQLLGDLVFVDMPELGAQINAGQEIGVVESVKAAADVYAPLACEVLEVNPQLESEPELVNRDPYNAGWLFKLKLSNTADLEELLEPSDYQSQLAAD